MKVCTDSCVFGAFVEVAEAKCILDIGAGTGLLSLMVAQRSNARIEAVEINPEAQQQAKQNFAASPWAERLHLHPVSLQEFSKEEQPKYDVILSNPPFFLSSLKSPDAAHNTARHTGELLFEDIVIFTRERLSESGNLYLLLPPAEAVYFAKLAQASGLYLSDTLQIHTYHGGKCIRHIQTYTFKVPASPTIQDFFIREEDKVTYTHDFVKLLREYYLAF